MSIDALRRTALRKLARREHSRMELQRVLSIKYPESKNAIDALLDELMAAGYLNEHRFTEAYVHARRERGYGPLRIQRELEEHGIVQEVIETYLNKQDPDWMVRMERVRQKRFGPHVPKDFSEKAKQNRYLHYKGFSI